MYHYQRHYDNPHSTEQAVLPILVLANLAAEVQMRVQHFAPKWHDKDILIGPVTKNKLKKNNMELWNKFLIEILCWFD